MPYSTCTQCPTLVPLGESRCAKHKATKSAPADRGYDAAHRRARRQILKLLTANGGGYCCRCNEWVRVPGDRWDLDHLPNGYGVSHAYCNRQAGGRNK